VPLRGAIGGFAGIRVFQALVGRYHLPVTCMAAARRPALSPEPPVPAARRALAGGADTRQNVVASAMRFFKGPGREQRYPLAPRLTTMRRRWVP